MLKLIRKLGHEYEGQTIGINKMKSSRRRIKMGNRGDEYYLT